MVLVCFQREGFVKSASSNSVQSFLDWFSETAMFSAFIESRLDRAGIEACGKNQFVLL